jgi:flagella basal body P-ring formation protein FlgA
MTNPTITALIAPLLIGLFIMGNVALAPTASADPGEPYLRETIEVDAPQILLGDLFENAGALADVAVLNAPPPGERLLLSIDDAFELANGNGLGWRPVAPFDFATITRAWRIIDHAELLDVIAQSLAYAGAGDNLKVEMPQSRLKVKVARGAIADLSVEETVYDEKSGQFRGVLVVRDGTGRARREQIFGRAFAFVELPVLRTRLRRDHVIDDDDIQWRAFRADRVPAEAVLDPIEIVGLSPARTVTPGKPVMPSDLRPPTIVSKGAIVAMRLVTERMQLVATGRALDSGALGDVIRIQNTQSRLVVEATVTGRERVSVRPASLEVAVR